MMENLLSRRILMRPLRKIWTVKPQGCLMLAPRALQAGMRRAKLKETRKATLGMARSPRTPLPALVTVVMWMGVAQTHQIP